MKTDVKLMVVLTKLNNTFLKTLGGNLEKLGISPTHYAILSHLNIAKKTKIQKLAEVAVITSGAITHNIKKLIKLGYIETFQDKSDKRIFWASITDNGAKVLSSIHSEHIAFLETLLKDFTENEKSHFIEQIKYFGKKIEQQRSYYENI